MADWQFDLNGDVTIGDSTNYTVLNTPGPKGLLGTAKKVQTLKQRGYGMGQVGNLATYTTRLITIPVMVLGSSPSDVRSTAQTLLDAWVLSTSDKYLDVQLPGSTVTENRFYGQPTEVAEIDVSHYGTDVLSFLLTFEALDPLAYNGTAEADDANTGTFTVTNQGNIASDRCTATINLAGGTTPVLTHNGESRAVTWTANVAAGTRVIDFREQTVVDGSGLNKLSEVTLSASWPRLLSGGNSFTIAGATDVDFSFRSAWSS